MKIAILSDIKSNVYALEEVIKDTKQRGIDVTLNLGDALYGPIAPRETYDLIRQSQFINICGNQDREILEASLAQLEEDKTLKFIYNDLGEDVLYWIQDLPFEKLIGGIYYMIHGTYFDDSQYLLEDVSSGKANLREDKKIKELLDNVEAQFIFCGHSHIPRCINLSSGQVIINPGSVGLQAYKSNKPNKHTIENNYTDASYVILTVENESYSIEQIKVAYDFEKAALKAQENGRDDWAYTLRTGKVLD